jgi:hypothetical protein
LVCEHCGLARDCERTSLSYVEGYEPFFELPLWLSVGCCGETLWAFNLRHLQFIERFVAARHRETRRDPVYGWSNRSLANRLPGWIQDRKNREAVLAGVARLKERLK